MTEGPDSILTEQIITSLRAQKLLPEKQLEDLRAKIAAGKIKAEDWHLMIDLAMEGGAPKHG